MDASTYVPSDRQEDWAAETNPHTERDLRDAWRDGAQSFWRGRGVEVHNYGTVEKAAFWAGYEAAEAAGSDDAETRP